MRSLNFLIQLILLFQLLCGAAVAAEITYHRSVDGQGLSELELSGEIADGDLDKLKRVINKLPNSDGSAKVGLLTLSSPGGSFSEGVKIAAFLRENIIATLIKKNDTCASACAFIFLGGTTQWEEGLEPNRMVEVGAKLLFHAPYVDLKDAKVNVQDMVREITNVSIGLNKKFAEFGVPSSIVPLLLTNEKDHTLYDATTIEAISLLKIKIRGFKNSGHLTESMVKNRCLNGWRLSNGEVPSQNRSSDLDNFVSTSKANGIQLYQNNDLAGNEPKVKVDAVFLDDYAGSVTCVVSEQARCWLDGAGSGQCPSVFRLEWDTDVPEQDFLFAVPPDTKLILASKVLADYNANEPRVFSAAISPQPPTPQPQQQTISPQPNNAVVCNSKSSISNIRSGPNPVHFNIVATLVNNSPVVILGTEKNPESGHDWLKVSSQGVQGFIDSDWIATSCSPEAISGAKPGAATICNKASETTNIRSGPNAQEFPIVATVKNGTKIELFLFTPNPVTGHPWYLIRTATGVGYVDAEKVGQC